MTGPRSSSCDGKIKFADIWCKVCKRPIGKRKSSMTSWIFQDSRCQCKDSAAADAPVQNDSTAEPLIPTEPAPRPLHKVSQAIERQIAED